MSQPSALDDSLQQAIASRVGNGMTVFHLDDPLPSSAPDFFSNDYLSLSTDRTVRNIFLRRVQAASPTRLLGSTGSRLATGNSSEFNALETAFKHFFAAPSALFMPSCFSANVAFVSAVPQKDDVIIYDEFVHVSFRDGIRISRCASYRFVHNSIASLEEHLRRVLQKHLSIARRNATVFILLESLYSMEGDFCPLTEIVQLVEMLVPSGHAHIVVDESHTSAICGPNGTGYVSHLGLNDRVHTRLHSFGKAWGFRGGACARLCKPGFMTGPSLAAIILTSPIVREYLINFSTSVMFSTAMPYTDMYALETCFGVVSTARGQEVIRCLLPSCGANLPLVLPRKLRQDLNRLSRYAREKICNALKDIPDTVLAVARFDATFAVSDRALLSPIIPVYTRSARSLANHLLRKGYAVSPLTYPVVKTPRIRISIHVSNTEEQINVLTNELVTWAELQQGASPHAGNTSRNVGVGESKVGVKSKL